MRLPLLICVGGADARRLKTAAGETQDNAVAALMLIAEYPAGTGNDEQLLRQTGNAVRVLAEVLELTAEAVDGYDSNPAGFLSVCESSLNVDCPRCQRIAPQMPAGGTVLAGVGSWSIALSEIPGFV